MSYADIADEVGCHKSTISIKLSRNGVLSGYSGVRAQKRYLECRVLGKHETGCLVAMAGKLSGKHADPLSVVVTKLLEGKPCETIAFDKGKEFARHQEIGNALGTKVYFSHPHSPWERGTKENTNGLLRQFFPKGKSMAQVSQKDVDAAVRLLNDRPRKCLDWKTSLEAFFRNTSSGWLRALYLI